MSTRRWSRSTPNASRERHRTSNAGSGSTRCSASSTPPAKRSPVCCARERSRELRRRPVGGGRDGDRPTARRTPTRSPTGRRPRQVVHPILVRADSAGAVRAFIDGLIARNCLFSISARVSNALDAAIAQVADDAWRPAVNAMANHAAARRSPSSTSPSMAGPHGTRAIVRRERPHPGAQLRLWDHNGMRHQVVLTNQPGDAVELELRHRRHGQVENRIKNLKDCGLERMPFTSFAANAAWMEMVLCRRRSARLDTDPAVHRRTRRRRATHLALPDPAHRRHG